MRREVDSEKKKDKLIQDYQTQGYKVKDETSDRVVMNKGLKGDWWWHIIIFLLFPILGNLVYSMWRRTGDDNVIIRVE